MTTLVFSILGAIVGLAIGFAWGERHKGRELAWWVDGERRERVAAEAQERAAKRRIGEQVRHERMVMLFGKEADNG